MPTLSELFDEEFLATIAENAPIEGEGLQRDFSGRIVNAYFQEAGAEYQKMVKAGSDPAIQICFDIENQEWEKSRTEKYTIGSGWRLKGGDGKTSQFVEATGKDKEGRPYTQFSSQSNYGRLYRDLTERWEVVLEGDGANIDDCTFELGDGSTLVVSPAGQRFFLSLKKNKKKVDPKDASIWVDVELQWSKEEWEDRKTGKTRDRAFPSALLFPGLEEVNDVAKSDKKAEVKTEAKKVEPKKEEVKAQKAEVKEEAVESSASGGGGDEDLLGQLTSLALEHDPPDYAKWRAVAVKLPGVQGVKKWINWCVMKKNFDDLVGGTAKVPA